MEVKRSENDRLWEKYLPPLWPPIWPPLWPPVWRPLPTEASREAVWHTHRLPRVMENRATVSDTLELNSSVDQETELDESGKYVARLSQSASQAQEPDTALERYSAAVQWEQNKSTESAEG